MTEIKISKSWTLIKEDPVRASKVKHNCKPRKIRMYPSGRVGCMNCGANMPIDLLNKVYFILNTPDFMHATND